MHQITSIVRGFYVKNRLKTALAMVFYEWRIMGK